MMDLRGQTRLAEEARPEAVIGHEGLAHDLDAARHIEMEVAGFEDLAHSSAAEAAQTLVFAVENRTRTHAVAGHGWKRKHTPVSALSSQLSGLRSQVSGLSSKVSALSSQVLALRS